MAPQLGWIGLGNMGRGMVKNLIEKADHPEPILIFNRTQSKADAIASSNPNRAKVSASIQDLTAASDIIFLCLGDDASVQDNIDTILSTPNTYLSKKLIVDCSTIHPSSTTKINDQITKAGASFAAMPVFGAPAMADSGQLVCVLAGPKAATERVKPYTTKVIGRALIDYTDQEPQKATLLKIIGNTFILSMITTLAEGHVLAEQTGLGTDELHQFIEQMFPGPYTAYSNRMRSGDYYTREEPLFAVDLARKDAGHALDLAKGVGGKMRFAEIADGYLKDVKEERGKKGDIAGIYGAKRAEAGLKFGNQQGK